VHLFSKINNPLVSHILAVCSELLNFEGPSKRLGTTETHIKWLDIRGQLAYLHTNSMYQTNKIYKTSNTVIYQKLIFCRIRCFVGYYVSCYYTQNNSDHNSNKQIWTQWMSGSCKTFNSKKLFSNSKPSNDEHLFIQQNAVFVLGHKHIP